MAALRHLRQLLSAYPGLQHELEVCDVLTNPEAGLRGKVLVTPMLVKLAPEPERRIFGDLRDPDLLRGVLGLRSPEAHSSSGS